MYTSNPKAIVFKLMSVLLLASTAGYAAVDAGSVQLTSTAEVEVIETDAHGKQHSRRVAAAEVVPGKDVIYTLSFENVGTEPGNDIVIQNPVPEHTVYKTGSASGKDTRISFSVDDGQHFSSAELLTVTEADGSTRIAKASEYTTIRWHYTKPLQPGDKSSVEFRVVLQ
ncbi:MAG: hypothetical protein WBP44_16710 [Gammaproteobacteria bacterium]|jgi:uncharacterized repeat protein (TIGR01451 family)